MHGKIYVIEKTSNPDKWDYYLSPEELFESKKFWGDSVLSVFEPAYNRGEELKLTEREKMLSSVDYFLRWYPEFESAFEKDEENIPYMPRDKFKAKVQEFADRLMQEMKEKANKFIRGEITFGWIKFYFRDTDLGDLSIVYGYDYYPNSIEILEDIKIFPERIYIIDVYDYHI